MIIYLNVKVRVFKVENKKLLILPVGFGYHDENDYKADMNVWRDWFKKNNCIFNQREAYFLSIDSNNNWKAKCVTGDSTLYSEDISYSNK